MNDNINDAALKAFGSFKLGDYCNHDFEARAPKYAAETERIIGVLIGRVKSAKPGVRNTTIPFAIHANAEFRVRLAEQLIKWGFVAKSYSYCPEMLHGGLVITW